MKTPFENWEEKSRALERILESGRTYFNLEEILTIIESYRKYDRSATRASKEIPYSNSTIIKYWRRAGFEIGKRGRLLDSREIQEIEEACNTYNGNACRASKKIDFSVPTIIKYWKKAGFNTKRGRKRGGENRTYSEGYQKYKQLIGEGHGQSKIKEELGISRQAVSYYLNYHPELRKLYDEKHKK